jgi:hypothetical protein
MDLRIEAKGVTPIPAGDKIDQLVSSQKYLGITQFH